eukprot:scaffold384157_cov32-Prasinocladus_malaysianus.AAC.1
MSSLPGRRRPCEVLEQLVDAKLVAGRGAHRLLRLFEGPGPLGGRGSAVLSGIRNRHGCLGVHRSLLKLDLKRHTHIVYLLQESQLGRVEH